MLTFSKRTEHSVLQGITTDTDHVINFYRIGYWPSVRLFSGSNSVSGVWVFFSCGPKE